MEELLALRAVLHDRGDHEAILRSARDEILPLAVSGDYARGVAMGASAVAQALSALNRMDEPAMRLRDFAIPAAEHAGNQGLRVLVREGLADALVSKEQLDRGGSRRVLREIIRIATEAGLVDHGFERVYLGGA